MGSGPFFNKISLIATHRKVWMKVKIVNLKGIKRVISGELLHAIDVDYTQSLQELKSDIEYALPILVDYHKSKKRFFFSDSRTVKNYVRVHEGSHHLDVVDDGIGSLGWLLVQDHQV